MAGGPHHTVLSTALTAEHLDDLAEMTGTELVAHRRRHHRRAASSGSCGGTRRTTDLAQGL